MSEEVYECISLMVEVYVLIELLDLCIHIHWSENPEKGVRWTKICIHNKKNGNFDEL